MKRAATIIHTLGAKAATTLHTREPHEVDEERPLRPMRSAIRPMPLSPMNIPTNDEAIRSCSAVPPRPYCAFRAVAMVPDKKISYTSKNRPNPIAMTTLR